MTLVGVFFHGLSWVHEHFYSRHRGQRDAWLLSGNLFEQYPLAWVSGLAHQFQQTWSTPWQNVWEAKLEQTSLERIRTKLINTNKKGFFIFTEFIRTRRMKDFTKDFHGWSCPPTFVSVETLIFSSWLIIKEEESISKYTLFFKWHIELTWKRIFQKYFNS